MKKIDDDHNRAFNLFLLFIFLMGLLFLIPGCKVREIHHYVEVPKIEKEYVEKIVKDSIHTTDSVLVYQKNDTIFLEKISIKYRDRLRVDTVAKIDSVTTVKTVEVVEYVNQLTKSQQKRLKLLNWLVLGLIVFTGFKLYQVYNRFLRK